MQPTPDAYDYSTETLLRRKARECAELRELQAAVAGELERLACAHPEHAERFLARADAAAAAAARGGQGRE